MNKNQRWMHLDQGTETGRYELRKLLRDCTTANPNARLLTVVDRFNPDDEPPSKEGNIHSEDDTKLQVKPRKKIYLRYERNQDEFLRRLR